MGYWPPYATAYNVFKSALLPFSTLWCRKYVWLDLPSINMGVQSEHLTSFWQQDGWSLSFWKCTCGQPLQEGHVVRPWRHQQGVLYVGKILVLMARNAHLALFLPLGYWSNFDIDVAVLNPHRLSFTPTNFPLPASTVWLLWAPTGDDFWHFCDLHFGQFCTPITRLFLHVVLPKWGQWKVLDILGVNIKYRSDIAVDEFCRIF